MYLRKVPSTHAAAFAIAVVLAVAPASLAGVTTIPPSPAEAQTPTICDWQASPAADGPRNITIIESQSGVGGHSTDVKWQTVAVSMGHTATIADQSALGDITNLDGTDILIVSSSVIELPAGHVQTILQFVESHGPAYLQGEYLSTLPGNQAFVEIVNGLGGSFTVSGTISGDLEPMNVLGSLATDPNAVPSLPFFWYGCAGTGDATIENFLEYGGNYFGWIFTPPGSPRVLIHTTDQDWVQNIYGNPESVALMENILTYLDDAYSPTERSTWGAIKSRFR